MGGAPFQRRARTTPPARTSTPMTRRDRGEGEAALLADDPSEAAEPASSRSGSGGGTYWTWRGSVARVRAMPGPGRRAHWRDDGPTELPLRPADASARCRAWRRPASSCSSQQLGPEQAEGAGDGPGATRWGQGLRGAGVVRRAARPLRSSSACAEGREWCRSRGCDRRRGERDGAGHLEHCLGSHVHRGRRGGMRHLHLHLRLLPGSFRGCVAPHWPQKFAAAARVCPQKAQWLPWLPLGPMPLSQVAH